MFDEHKRIKNLRADAALTQHTIQRITCSSNNDNHRTHRCVRSRRRNISFVRITHDAIFSSQRHLRWTSASRVHFDDWGKGLQNYRISSLRTIFAQLVADLSQHCVTTNHYSPKPLQLAEHFRLYKWAQSKSQNIADYIKTVLIVNFGCEAGPL